MTLSIETLFTTALGLHAPWVVKDVELNTAKAPDRLSGRLRGEAIGLSRLWGGGSAHS